MLLHVALVNFFNVLFGIYVALVHEALAIELPAAPRLGTVHGLLVSVACFHLFGFPRTWHS